MNRVIHTHTIVWVTQNGVYMSSQTPDANPSFLPQYIHSQLISLQGRGWCLLSYLICTDMYCAGRLFKFPRRTSFYCMLNYRLLVRDGRQWESLGGVMTNSIRQESKSTTQNTRTEADAQDKYTQTVNKHSRWEEGASVCRSVERHVFLQLQSLIFFFSVMVNH